MKCFDFQSRIKWFVYLPFDLANIANQYVGPELFGKTWTVNHNEFAPFRVQTIVGNDIIWAWEDEHGEYTMRNSKQLPVRGKVQYVNEEWIVIGNTLYHLASDRVITLSMADPVVCDGKLYYTRDKHLYCLQPELSNEACEVDVNIGGVIGMQVVGHNLNIHFPTGIGVIGHSAIYLSSLASFEWHRRLWNIDRSYIVSAVKQWEFHVPISYVVPKDNVLFVHCGLKSFLVHWDTMGITELNNHEHLQRGGNRLFSTQTGLHVYE